MVAVLLILGACQEEEQPIDVTGGVEASVSEMYITE